MGSSTIGNGDGAGGLTINGGATTTANAYFGGNVYAPELVLATSTSITVDFMSSNVQLIRTGTSATTITFTNIRPGARLTLNTCSPGSTAGAITFSGAKFSGGVQPGNTTTANLCDSWYFQGTAATGTTAAVLTGMTPGW
jgi:hypothetical protein